jgi:hypothetical protein
MVGHTTTIHNGKGTFTYLYNMSYSSIFLGLGSVGVFP